MFGFFKKKTEAAPVTKDVAVHAVANGTVIPISDVNDVVFAQKMMGDGFAVIPTDGTITSPVAGEVTSVFPSQHAIGITTPNGLEVLVHMGINTVELNGKGFTTSVKPGDQVTPETVLSTVDLDVLKEEGKDTAMIVILTNMDVVESFTLNTTGDSSAKTAIGNVIVK